MKRLLTNTLYAEHKDKIVRGTKTEKFYRFPHDFTIQAPGVGSEKDVNIFGHTGDVLRVVKEKGKNHYQLIRGHEWELKMEDVPPSDGGAGEDGEEEDPTGEEQ